MVTGNIAGQQQIKMIMKLFDFLLSLNGATIVELTTLSNVEMNKRNNPLYEHNVTKRMSRNVQFGYNYENAVNNRLAKIGEERTFTTSHLPWGEWAVLENGKRAVNKIIAHKGNFYGRFYVLNSGTTTPTTYYVDGKPATASALATIKQFERKQVRKDNERQNAEGLTENQVKPFTVKFGDILAIKVNGIEHTFDK